MSDYYKYDDTSRKTAKGKNKTGKGKRVFRSISYFLIFLGGLAVLFFEVWRLSKLSGRTDFLQKIAKYMDYIKVGGLGGTLLGGLLLSITGHKKIGISVVAFLFMLITIGNILVFYPLGGKIMGDVSVSGDTALIEPMFKVPVITDKLSPLFEAGGKLAKIGPYVKIISFGALFLALIIFTIYTGIRKPRMIATTIITVGLGLFIVAMFAAAMMEGLMFVNAIKSKLLTKTVAKYINMGYSGLVGVSYILVAFGAFIGVTEAKKD